MKTPSLYLGLAAAFALIGAGCSSTDYQSQSRTAKGAEIGAATGAVLGGVVGHQSNETNAGAAVGAVAGGLAGAAIGHHAEQRDAAAARVGDTAYTVQAIPPTPTSQPYETMPPQPAANTVWVRGHYEYTGAGYQWIPGRWETPPAGMQTWVEPTWQPAANGGYIYTRGHWQ
jgi:hypothetical protein